MTGRDRSLGAHAAPAADPEGGVTAWLRWRTIALSAGPLAPAPPRSGTGHLCENDTFEVSTFYARGYAPVCAWRASCAKTVSVTAPSCAGRFACAAQWRDGPNALAGRPVRDPAAVPVLISRRAWTWRRYPVGALAAPLATPPRFRFSRRRITNQRHRHFIEMRRRSVEPQCRSGARKAFAVCPSALPRQHPACRGDRQAGCLNMTPAGTWPGDREDSGLTGRTK